MSSKLRPLRSAAPGGPRALLRVLQRLEPVLEHPVRLVLLGADLTHHALVQPLAAAEYVLDLVREAVLVFVEVQCGDAFVDGHWWLLRLRF
jgi:hypothetical protein